MSLCTVCGRAFCLHTPEERGQTPKEMVRPLNKEEVEAWENGGVDLIELAIKNAHLFTPE